MGAEGAANIVFRREIEAAEDSAATGRGRSSTAMRSQTRTSRRNVDSSIA